MGKLRKTVQREIVDALDTTSFTSDDFTVSFGDPDKSEFLYYIQFIHDENYTYGVTKRTILATDSYTATMRPGDIEEEQHKAFTSLSLSMEEIPNWCIEIRSDLKASQPLYGEIDKLRNIIEDNILNTGNDNDEFSVSEISDLQQKFSELQQRVIRLEEDQLITQKQLDEFLNGINQVSEDLEFYPKKTWIKTAANKLTKTVISIGKSKEGRQLISDGAKKLLGLD